MSRSITVEDLLNFKLISMPRIAPDGHRVAFTVTTIDERTLEYRSAIWMVSSAGGEAKRFVTGQGNAHSPCWSPGMDGYFGRAISTRQRNIPW